MGHAFVLVQSLMLQLRIKLAPSVNRAAPTCNATAVFDLPADLSVKYAKAIGTLSIDYREGY